MKDCTELLKRAEARFPRPHHADDGLMVQELCAAIRELIAENGRLGDAAKLRGLLREAKHYAWQDCSVGGDDLVARIKAALGDDDGN